MVTDGRCGQFVGQPCTCNATVTTSCDATCVRRVTSMHHLFPSRGCRRVAVTLVCVIHLSYLSLTCGSDFVKCNGSGTDQILMVQL